MSPSFLSASCDVVLNEVLANPAGDEGTDESLEIHNRGSVPVDLAGWKITEPLGDELNDTIVDFTGPFDAGQPGTVLQPGWFAVVVDPQYAGALNAEFGDPAKFILVQSTGDVTLGNGLANAADDVGFEGPACVSTFSWTSDSGNGVSWEKKNPWGSDDPDNWIANRHGRHSLGGPNGVSVPVVTLPPGSVVINEFVYDASGVDNGSEWIELFNTISDPVDLSGWTVESAGSSFARLVSLSSGTISSHGHFVLAQSTSIISDYSYSASSVMQNGGSEADGIRLLDASGGVQDTVVYGSTSNARNLFPGDDGLPVPDQAIAPKAADGHSLARKSDGQDTNHGADDFLVDLSPTPGQSNDPTTDPPPPLPPKPQPIPRAPPPVITAAPVTEQWMEVLPPNPFTPYESQNQEGQIGFHVPLGAVKTIRVFDVQGREVAFLVNRDRHRSGVSLVGVDDGTVSWDGKDDNGNILPMGIYVVHFQAEDGSGNIVGKKTDTIVLGRRL